MQMDKKDICHCGSLLNIRFGLSRLDMQSQLNVLKKEESNKLPYLGSFSSVYSCAALVDLKIAQRQTLKKIECF